ncbi:MAG: methyltransferase [Pseudomonadota bacterium]
MEGVRSVLLSARQQIESLRESHILTLVVHGLVIAAAGVAWFHTGLHRDDLSVLEVAAVIFLAVGAALLLPLSLFGLITYFLNIPSVRDDGHIFSRVHALHLLHPLTTALILGSLALCIYAGSMPAWAVWGTALAAFLLQTISLLKRLRKEYPEGSTNGARTGNLFLLLSLVLGGELLTITAGAKPIFPWKIHSLPLDTWIVDVRTKTEFQWNRLHGAENYPWGEGVVEAAAGRDPDRPVLVTCFSGHRSLAVAVLLRRLGFKSVYNLNWGVLYLVLLERGRRREGPFALTKPHKDPNRRGNDYRGISIAYVSLIFLALIGAPTEHFILDRDVSTAESIIGALFAATGGILGGLSFLALGRNFRVYAAPRRSGSLVTTGVYSIVRHPMYTGVILWLGGYVLIWGSLFFIPVWITVTGLYVLKAVKEEPLLYNKFPDYEEYVKRTWRFFPYIN